ncbi:hypothetical protein DY000_02034416 [Brassica cretica]|uniref:Uncharacterized protein n=1 Tax=Brassica cretica TaxID=69181 RepID=A0ABQ7E078_BRACR|nr:hypothetical protein DY000_02034416 [Brassica cretica]
MSSESAIGELGETAVEFQGGELGIRRGCAQVSAVKFLRVDKIGIQRLFHRLENP